MRITERLSRYVRAFKKSAGINLILDYPDFSIKLPADHMLRIYQLRHKRYDRFLPHLTKYLDPNSTVIDVGANCGDTLAGMISTNQQLGYICIEPDPYFFDYLESNILRIREAYEGAKIHAVKSLVGKEIKSAILEGSDGTKHAIANKANQGLVSRTLDHLLSSDEYPNISLLKIDVDGYDYDVINSAEILLRTQQPIIFFECQYESESQRSEYEQTITNLRSLGYERWAIFDNFGELVLRTDDVGYLFQLMNYVWRQNIASTTRTIYYYDILVAAKCDISLLDRAIDQFK